MAPDRYEDLDVAELRALVDALPLRLLPLVAAGVMTSAEAEDVLRNAREVLAARPRPASPGGYVAPPS